MSLHKIILFHIPKRCTNRYMTLGECHVEMLKWSHTSAMFAETSSQTGTNASIVTVSTDRHTLTVCFLNIRSVREKGQKSTSEKIKEMDGETNYIFLG